MWNEMVEKCNFLCFESFKRNEAYIEWKLEFLTTFEKVL